MLKTALVITPLTLKMVFEVLKRRFENCIIFERTFQTMQDLGGVVLYICTRFYHLCLGKANKFRN